MVRTIVLLSGGLDSTVAATLAARTSSAQALTFAYGQRHDAELSSAREVARHLRIDLHEIVLESWGGSVLTTSGAALPRDADTRTPGIPSTYVPGRNLVFLACAAAYAEAVGADVVMVGSCGGDVNPDGSAAFTRAVQRVWDVGTRRGVEGDPITLVTPFAAMRKAEVITLGVALGAPLAMTASCYDPVWARGAGEERLVACAHCSACLTRRRGFLDAGVPDPTWYVDLPLAADQPYHMAAPA